MKIRAPPCFSLKSTFCDELQFKTESPINSDAWLIYSVTLNSGKPSRSKIVILDEKRTFRVLDITFFLFWAVAARVQSGKRQLLTHPLFLLVTKEYDGVESFFKFGLQTFSVGWSFEIGLKKSVWKLLKITDTTFDTIFYQ